MSPIGDLAVDKKRVHLIIFRLTSPEKFAKVNNNEI